MLRVHMAPEEYTQLLGALRELRPRRFLEWGTGGSTAQLLADCEFIERYVAVEHDRDWFERVRAVVGDPRLELHHVPPAEPPPRRGLFKHRLIAWNARAERDPAVLADYVALPKTLGISFDGVLVDGRARRFCLPAGWALLRSGGLLVLHDAQRADYRDALFSLGAPRLLEPWSRGQVALLTKAQLEPSTN
jgi:hypothetical protein